MSKSSKTRKDHDTVKNWKGLKRIDALLQTGRDKGEITKCSVGL